MTRRADVRATWDRITPHFAKTRPDPWPEVATFLEARSGQVGIDIGTGNGRHAELLADRVEQVIALDISRTALDVCLDRSRRRGFPVERVQADGAELPIRADSIDLAVFVAVLHHLPRRRLRIQSLDELSRVLARNGSAIVSAWSVSHDRFEVESAFDTHLDWTLPDGSSVPRYYHIYDMDEFEADIRGSTLRVGRLFASAGNCYAIVTPEGT